MSPSLHFSHDGGQRWVFKSFVVRNIASHIYLAVIFRNCSTVFRILFHFSLVTFLD